MPRDERSAVDVIVVGGGLAGIAAAAGLRAHGVDALLVEADGDLGGKVRATAAGVPRGPLVWEAKRTAIGALLRLLHLDGDVVPVAPSSRARWVLRDGRLRGLRPTPQALLTTRALSWRDRFMLATEPLRMRWARPPGDDEDESVASFFTRHLGRALAERLAFAMVNGIWAGDPHRLSMRACFPELYALVRRHRSLLLGMWRARAAPPPALPAAASTALAATAGTAGTTGTTTALATTTTPAPTGTLALRGGLWAIGAAAAAQLPVRTGAPVVAVQDEAGGSVRVTLASGEVLRAAAVVLATDAPAAARLWPRRDDVAALLADVPYAPLSVVHWRETTPGSSGLPAGFGWLAPPREGTFALGTLFVTDLVGGGDDDGGRRRFASFVGGAQHPERAAAGDDALARGLDDELRALTGGAFGELLHVERQPRAVAQPTLGHAARVARLQAATRDGAVVLAGSYLGGGAMRDAVETGFAAAAAVVDRLPALRAASQAAVVAAPSSPSSPPPTTTVSSSSSSSSSSATAASAEVVPLLVLGASYRELPTEGRARLAQLEEGPDAPSRALVSAGYADGVVVLATCSRVEWIVSTKDPRWAAELLRGALLTRVPGARVHVRSGRAAAHYLLRVAMGLDSVAEGEPAVGRQMVLAFERAHLGAHADRGLRRCWRAVQHLVSERRRRGVVRHGLGVQTLVVDALVQRGVAHDAAIAVLGQGEIGRAVVGALNAAGFRGHVAFRRDGRAAFDALAGSCAAVVVCTGAPEAHVALPPRDDGPLVVDVGVPAQVRAAPGWTSVALEDLLAHPRRLLDDGTRSWLVEQVGTAADRLAKELAAPAPAGTLSVIDEERRVFLRETLPPLLAHVPPPHAEEVRRACAAFAHALIERVRAEGNP
jgi:oxygen-dependent protoporphyrinogen oxidase